LPVSIDKLLRRNRRLARQKWGSALNPQVLESLAYFSKDFSFSISTGDLLLLDQGWYVTHSGLIRLARRKRCHGILVQPAREFCDPKQARWAFEATVYKSKGCKGFVGYGDADPSNVSFIVHGAEMRIAETRAVNRALRKAYGIGICSVEEIGSSAESSQSSRRESKEAPSAACQRELWWANSSRPPLPAYSSSTSSTLPLSSRMPPTSAESRLFGKPLASRSKTSSPHLSDWADKNRDALLCQLNSYLGAKEGAA
jgi:hypothetical protein